MSNRQTNLDDFLHDMVCFIEEKVTEALADPASQFAAIEEAACAIPLMRQRLGENEVRWAQFVLVLDVKIETGWWQDWWREFAKMQRDDFVRTAGEMLEPNGALQALKSVLKP
jgi:hypothetical protein